MIKIREKLEKIMQELEEMVEQREIKFEERTETWQESERGEFFEQKTYELEEAAESIGSAINSIDEYSGR